MPSRLESRLAEVRQEEREQRMENARLEKVVKEQQKVIRMALNRIIPAQGKITFCKVTAGLSCILGLGLWTCNNHKAYYVAILSVTSIFSLNSMLVCIQLILNV